MSRPKCFDFRAESGDQVLKQHFETAPRNANYRSKTIQNEMIQCCGEYISDSLVQEIKEAKIFAVLADEASDVSNREQMALIIRFVDKQHMIREEFLRFIHCEAGTSGEAIAAQAKEEVRNLGLAYWHCVQFLCQIEHMAGKMHHLSTWSMQATGTFSATGKQIACVDQLHFQAISEALCELV